MTHELESFLRERRPEPSPEFVARLEERVLAAPKKRRRRPLVILCAAGAAAVVIVVLGVVGALPLGLGSDAPVRATDGCVTVIVEKTERRPVFKVDSKGDLGVTYRTERVQRPERRCDRR